MRLPFRYAVRNLFRDPVRLAQTVAGSALVVLLVMSAEMLNRGMRETLRATGSPRNVILLGAGSEESVQRSEVADRAAGIAEAGIRGIEEIAGARSVSPEIHYMTPITVADRVREDGYLRGVLPAALRVHREIAVIDGRFHGPGEVTVGRLAWKRLGVRPGDLRPGAILRLDDTDLTVSGVFAAPGTVMESEIWADLNDLRALARRETISCVVLRLRPEADPSDAELFARQRLDLELTAMTEQAYYDRLAKFYAPVRAMTWLTAALIAAGAVFGGLNTIYAAFASRIREIGTLQAIGFSPPAVLWSFLQESTLAAMTGAVFAGFLASALSGRFTLYFSTGAFTPELTPETAWLGLLTGAALGVIGAIPPALRCLVPPLPAALREG